MELVMATAIAIMYGAGTYMILRPNMLRIIMGFGLYSNATNLLLIAIGGYTQATEAPFMSAKPGVAPLMDPLPPDIILTAIVISFAVGALMLVMAAQIYKDYGTDDPQQLPMDDDISRAVPVACVNTDLPLSTTAVAKPTTAKTITGAKTKGHAKKAKKGGRE